MPPEPMISKKKILICLGIATIVVTIGIVGLILRFQGTATLAESTASRWVDQICANFDPSVPYPLFDREVLAKNTQADVDSECARFSKYLGPMISRDKLELVGFKASRDPKFFFRCPAVFKKGRGLIAVTVIKRSIGWKIAAFQIFSPLLKEP